MEPSGAENTDSVARQASSFGTAAAAYAEHRPGYADAAVDWALSPVRDRHPLRVLDLAAGTGKLTATLVGLAAEVTAVEPDPAMLAELRRELGSAPALRALAGTAEEIPLPDASVDAVLVGQAMHWFDLDRAWRSPNVPGCWPRCATSCTPAPRPARASSSSRWSRPCCGSRGSSLASPARLRFCCETLGDAC